MKILIITAGAANMYCGSCLRDNALAAELKKQGHDVILLPLCTPTHTDEPNVSHPKVFFGGISIYLEQYSGLFRRMPRLLDRLWDSPALIKAFTGRGMKVSARVLGEMTVSMLRGENGHQRKELDKLMDWLRAEPAPDVVNLPNSMLIALARPIREALNRPVCCTLQGEDLFLDSLPEPYRSESIALIRDQVDSVDAFLPVSEFYAGYMARYLKIPESKMSVVPLGINMAGYASNPALRSEPFRIGYLARIAPEKGLHLLCEAYRSLRQRARSPRCHLEAAGYLSLEHRPYLEGIQNQMREWRLADEFHYHGVVDREQKIEFLRSLDAFVMPCTYDEPKGIPVLEAMACGVPVIAPHRGAFPEIMDKTGGGVLVDPDSADSMADGLEWLWQNESAARQLRFAGYEGVRRHYSVEQEAARVLEVYQQLTSTVPQRAAQQ